MHREGETAEAVTTRGPDRALWIAGALWGFWVVLPSLVLHAGALKPSAARAFISAQVGPDAVPYLGAAPQPALTFLLASYLLASPVLLLIVQRVRRGAATSVGGRGVVSLVLRRCGTFAALYLAGSAVVAAGMRLRGMPGELVWGWAPRLAIYGLFATLPQLGWAFAVALVVRRLVWSLVATLLGLLVCGAASPVLATKQVLFPTPLALRADLLSGRAEAVLPALFGLLLWGLALALIGLAVRELRAHRLVRAAAV